MSWNPTPAIGGANWFGNPPLATTKQLVSTTQGLEVLINDISGGVVGPDLVVSTLTAANYISTPFLNVSTIQAQNISTSGLFFDISGSIVADYISTNTNQSVINYASTYVFETKISPTINITVDLGLGEAISGALQALGIIVGSAIGAVGLIIYGLETGILGLFNSRTTNYITNNTYETFNLTTQLQFSTLKGPDPIYSSIWRTTDSINPASTFGSTIFLSTLFPVGTKCVRSVSDPIEQLTKDASGQPTFLQSFGQWVPLQTELFDYITSLNISSGTISSGSISTVVMKSDLVDTYAMSASTVGIYSQLYNDYGVPNIFKTGATNEARILGSSQNLYQSITPGHSIVYQTYTDTGPSAYLTLNSSMSSFFYASSISSQNFSAGTITADILNVYSSIINVSTTVENVLSTSTIVTDTATISSLNALYLSSFNFSTQYGNPSTQADITKITSLVSTNYNAVSSLTNNILYYSLTETIGDQTQWNLNAYDTPQGILYNMNPQNAAQWGSTLMIFNDYQAGGGCLLTGPDTFSTVGMTNTFDIQMQANPNTPGYCASFYLQQRYAGTTGQASTIVNVNNNPSGYPPPVFGYWRFTIGPSGWITSVENNPAPYETTNNNTLSIRQDINDVTIATTDNLNLEAGQINFLGQLNLEHFNVQNLYATEGNISTLITPLAQCSTIHQQVTYDPSYNNLIQVDYLQSLSTVSSLTSTTQQILAQAAFEINNYQSYASTIIGRPDFTASLGNGNSIFLGPGDSYGVNGVGNIPNRPWVGGTITLDVGTGTNVNLQNFSSNATPTGQLINIVNASPNSVNLYMFGYSPNPYTLPANTSVSCYWNAPTDKWLTPTALVPWPPYIVTDTFGVNQGYQSIEVDTGEIFATGDVVVNGNLTASNTSFLQGPIRTNTASIINTGIECTIYTDNTIVWSFIGGSTAGWDSTALNPIERPGGGYYNSDEWTPVISLLGFVPASDVGYGLTAMQVFPTIMTGGIWGVQRYINITHVGPPGQGNIQYTQLMIPNNYIASN